MDAISFTAVSIAALVGLIITLIFAYFPSVRVWYAALPVEKESLLKLGLMVLVAGAMFGLSFTSIFPPPLNLPSLLSVLGALILTNQPLASMLPSTTDVRMAIRARIARLDI